MCKMEANPQAWSAVTDPPAHKRPAERAAWIAFGLSWALFWLSRAAVLTAAPLGDGQGWAALWAWPRAGQAGLVLVAALAAGALLLMAGRWWLGRRGLAGPAAWSILARAARPLWALLIAPAMELLGYLWPAPAPIALAQTAWPLLALAALAAVAGQVAAAAPAPPKTGDAPRPRPWLAALVFVASLAVCAGVGARLVAVKAAVGPFLAGDEPHHLLCTHSLAVDHDWDLANNIRQRDSRFFDRPEALVDGHGRPGPAGGWYSNHRPGLAALAAPFYAWGLMLGRDVHRWAVAVLWLCMAWLAAGVYGLGRDLTGRVGPALAGAAALVLCLPGLLYANLFFPEVAAAALLLAGLRRALRAEALAWPGLLFTGLIIAGLPWLHERFTPLALILAGLAAWRLRRRPAGLVALGLPLAAAAALFMRLMWVQYGRLAPPTDLHGWGHVYLNPRGVWEGLSGLWVDGAEGLFTYAPLWLAGLAGLAWLARRRPSAGWPALALLAVTYLTAGLFTDWHGGQCPPSRYLVVALPLLALGLSAGLAWGPPRLRLAALALALPSAAAGLYALVYPPSLYGHAAALQAWLDWPLLTAWLPTWVLAGPGKTAVVNAALAGLWLALALGLALCWQFGRRRFAPSAALAWLAGGCLVVTAVAGAASAIGPGLAGPGQVQAQVQTAQTLGLWRRLAGVEGGAVLLRPADAAGRAALAGRLSLDLPPRRHARAPAQALKHAPGVSAPAGAAGLIVCCQYLDLPPGRYRAVFDLQPPAGSGPGLIASADVAASGGRAVLVRAEASAPGELALAFSLAAPASGVEVRLTTSGRAALTVSGLRLERLAARP